MKGKSRGSGETVIPEKDQNLIGSVLTKKVKDVLLSNGTRVY